MFVKTDTVLDTILAHKTEEIATAAVPLAAVRESAETAPPARDFLVALRRETVALIAEAKKASPSKGVLIADFDPVTLAATYAQNGAAAISVLTDIRFFQGHPDYLTAVRQAVDVPVLRKDFVIDPYQVYEARSIGADAVLLIVAALEDAQIADLYALVRELGMMALVEVHTEAEMERALKLRAQLVGINNRNLKTFEVNLATTGRLAGIVPDSVTLVAESGIRCAEDVYHMGQLGAHAVLVGETLVKAGDNLSQTVRAFSSRRKDQAL